MNTTQLLVHHCKVCGLPPPELEYRFDTKRRWRFDFAWPSPLFMVAAEIEGGIYRANSGHRSYAGVMRDIEKYNTATLQGWRVIRVTPQMVENGEAVTLIEKAIKREA